jgi:hypothetical protein
MKLKTPAHLVLAAAILLVPSSRVRAGSLVVGNLDQPAAPSSPDTLDDTFSLAEEFTTGSSGTTLDHIFASLGRLDTGNAGDFTLTAQLVADSGDTPTGALLTGFTFAMASIPGTGFATVAFDPTSSVTLAANTSYWFVLSGTSSDGSGSVAWQWTDSLTSSGPGSLPNFATNSTISPGWSVSPNQPYLIQVNASVPEPASWVLAGLGFAGLSLARARRAARRAVTGSSCVA